MVSSGGTIGRWVGGRKQKAMGVHKDGHRRFIRWSTTSTSPTWGSCQPQHHDKGSTYAIGYHDMLQSALALFHGAWAISAAPLFL